MDSDGRRLHKAAVHRSAQYFSRRQLRVHIHTDLHYGTDRIPTRQQKSGT